MRTFRSTFFFFTRSSRWNRSTAIRSTSRLKRNFEGMENENFSFGSHACRVARRSFPLCCSNNFRSTFANSSRRRRKNVFRLKFRSSSSQRCRLSNEKSSSSVFNWSKTVDYRQLNGAMRILLGLRLSNRTGWLIEKKRTRTNTSHCILHRVLPSAGDAIRLVVLLLQRKISSRTISIESINRSIDGVSPRQDRCFSSLFDQYLTSEEPNDIGFFLSFWHRMKSSWISLSW